MSELVTLELPEDVARSAKEVAARTQRRVEDGLVEWIDHSVADLPVESLADAQVLALCDSQMTLDEYDELSELLAQNREGELDVQGRVGLDQLMTNYRRGLVRKAQALNMYGYRQSNLDVTRLFVTPDVEERFRIINDSEAALREVIRKYPNEEYRGIRIGGSLSATRKNVLNPNNIGAYAASRSYFPQQPNFKRSEVDKKTKQLDKILDRLYPDSTRSAIQITIDQMIDLVKLTGSNPTGSGLWDDKRIIASLETLKKDERYSNTAYLIVRRRRDVKPNAQGLLRALLAGATREQPQGDLGLAVPNFPTLYMYRLTGNGWDNSPFWVPNIRFPDGQYALMFNFE